MKSKNSTKRIVTLALAALLLLQIFPVGSFATGENLCAHHPEHTAECGFDETGICAYICTEPHAKTVTAYSWEDSWEVVDVTTNTVTIPDVSEETPIDLDTVLAFLPSTIVATTDGGEKRLNLSWRCEDEFPAMATSGQFVFTGALDEDYILGDGVNPLRLTVSLDESFGPDPFAAEELAAESFGYTPIPSYAAREGDVVITDYAWVDDWDVVTPNGRFAVIPDVSEETPIDLNAVRALLPANIAAIVDGAEQTLPITWECTVEFPAAATSGAYTFYAVLGEGYALAEGVSAPVLTVDLGGLVSLDPVQPEDAYTEEVISYNLGAPITYNGESYYPITNITDLNEFASMVASGNSGANGMVMTPIQGTLYRPIGAGPNAPFTGKFTTAASNITMQLTLQFGGSSAGLFGYVAYPAEISNLKVIYDPSTSIGAEAISGLVGSMCGGTIQSCSVVYRDDFGNTFQGVSFGGIVGNIHYFNTCSPVIIRGCTVIYFPSSFSATSNIQRYFGGIVGSIGLQMSTSLSSGFPYTVFIDGCSVTAINAQTSGTAPAVWGVGAGAQYKGGIIGYCNNTTSQPHPVTSCLVSGITFGGNGGGAIVGEVPSSYGVLVNRCLATSLINCSGVYRNSVSGGVIVESCHSDGSVSGTTTFTSAQLKSGEACVQLNKISATTYGGAAVPFHQMVGDNGWSIPIPYAANTLAPHHQVQTTQYPVYEHTYTLCDGTEITVYNNDESYTLAEDDIHTYGTSGFYSGICTKCYHIQTPEITTESDGETIHIKNRGNFMWYGLHFNDNAMMMATGQAKKPYDYHVTYNADLTPTVISGYNVSLETDLNPYGSDDLSKLALPLGSPIWWIEQTGIDAGELVFVGADAADNAAFSGTFYGNGHVFNDLYWYWGFVYDANKKTDRAALYDTADGATFLDLGFTNGEINAYDQVAFFACTATNCTFERCYVENGDIGLGSNGGRMKDAGGFVVVMNGGSMTDCYTDLPGMSFSGYTSNMGGFAGKTTGTPTFTNCHSTVDGFARECGSFAGTGNITVSNCYARSYDFVGSNYTAEKLNGSGYKSAEVFASGELAWHLNNGVTDGTQLWYQDLDNGGGPADHPMLTGGTVYRGRDVCGGPYVYRNSPLLDYEEHSYNDDGFCSNPSSRGGICCAYQPAVGSGSSYRVSNAGQLYWVASAANGTLSTICGDTTTGRKARLSISIDADITVPDYAPDWDPIGRYDTRNGNYGSYSDAFYGTLDGNDHYISGLRCVGTDVAGLVGYAEYVTISDLTVKNSSFSGRYAGAFVGITNDIWTNSSFDNCHSIDNTIVGTRPADSTDEVVAGGVVGMYTAKNITDCTNNSSVTVSVTGERTDTFAGGIAGCMGHVSGVTVSNCSNSGAVSGAELSAGIVGDGDGSLEDVAITIRLCANTGSVEGTYPCGIFGDNSSTSNSKTATITTCYNQGALTTTGGTSAAITRFDGAVITDCYSNGSTNANSGKRFFAGTTGLVGTSVTNSYALSGTVDSATINATTGLAALSASEFSSGKAAWLLNGQLPDNGSYRQNIDNNITPYDAAPNFTSEGLVYYGFLSCFSNPKTGGVYTNTRIGPDFNASHNFDENGFCTNINPNNTSQVCGCYEPCYFITDREGDTTTDFTPYTVRYSDAVLGTHDSKTGLPSEQVGTYAAGNAGQLLWFAMQINWAEVQEDAYNGVGERPVLLEDTNVTPKSTLVLYQDIDLNPGYEFITDEFVEGDGIAVSGDKPLVEWTPIGLLQTRFARGAILGNNHAVRGVYISQSRGEDYNTSAYGFVGVTLGCIIKDLTLENAYIRYKDDNRNVGGILGAYSYDDRYATGNTGGYAELLAPMTIDNCHYNGIVIADGSFCGGILCGMFNGVGTKDTLTVKNCTTSGMVISNASRAGGIISTISGGATVQNCVNYATIKTTNAGNSTAAAGGIVGGTLSLGESLIEDCRNYGSIQGVNHAAGIAGEFPMGVMQNCINEGEVTGKEAAGLVGSLGEQSGATARVAGCANRGDIHSTNGTIGRAVGLVRSIEENSTLSNSYHYGYLNGVSGAKLGGIFDMNEGTVRNCAAVQPSHLDTIAVHSGSNNGSIDAETVFMASTEMFRSGKVTYIINQSMPSGAEAWDQNVDNYSTHNPYPMLESLDGVETYDEFATVYRNQRCFGTGIYTYSNTSRSKYADHNFNTDGFCSHCYAFQPATAVTADNRGELGLSESYVGYYAVGNPGQLYWISSLVAGSLELTCGTDTPQNTAPKVVLTADCKLISYMSIEYEDSGYHVYNNDDRDPYWNPMGTKVAPFTGIFDGNGHTVSRMYTDEMLHGGMFMFNNGTVKNTTLQTVFHSSEEAGGIVSFNNGTIDNCAVEGVIGGVEGGVCYQNDGTLTRGAYRATVYAYDNFGGVANINNNTLTDSYARGAVYIEGAGVTVGGICHTSNGSVAIEDSYAVLQGTAASAASYDAIARSVTVAPINCFYASYDSDGTDDLVTMGTNKSGCTEETGPGRFASGEITWLLNGGTSGSPGTAVVDGTQKWYQDIDNGVMPYDQYPEFTAGTVYYAGDCSASVFKYSNSATFGSEHSYNEYGFCENIKVDGVTPCGHFEPATLVTADNRDGLGLTADFDGYYAIKNAGQLYWFAAHVNYADPSEASDYVNGGNANANAEEFVKTAGDTVVENAVLLADVDLSVGAPTGLTWEPLGRYSDHPSVSDNNRCFGGDFNGQKHIVTGMTVTQSDPCEAGFFGRAYNGSVENLGVYGTVSQTCNLEVDGDTGVRAGIFAGQLRNTTVSDCYAVGTVSSENSEIGFSGSASGATLSNCYVYSTAQGSYYPFLGYWGSVKSVNNCYYLASNDTELDTHAGTTAVTAAQFTSGEITYRLNGQTSDASNVWRQDIDNNATPYDTYPLFSGGIVYPTGRCSGTTFGYSNSAGVVSYAHSYNENGFCTNEREDGTMCGHFEPAVVVTEDNWDDWEDLGLTADHVGYYAIENAGQLYWFAAHINYADPDTASDYVNFLNAKTVAEDFAAVDDNGTDSVEENAVLLADIDLTDDAPAGLLWDPIGRYSDDENYSDANRRYKGIFDGNKHIVTNMVVRESDPFEAGFFGRMYRSTVKYLGIEDASVVQSSDFIVRAGLLAGEAHESTILNCYATGGCYSPKVGQSCAIAGEAASTTLTNCFGMGRMLTADGTLAADAAYLPLAYINTTTFNNSYYLAADTTELDTHAGTTAKTAAQFTSGEVTWLLNGSVADSDSTEEELAAMVWKQTLTGATPDVHPVFVGENVFFGYTDCSHNTIAYSNTQPGAAQAHNFDENGFCTNPTYDVNGAETGVCRHFQPATQVTADNWDELGLSAEYVDYYAIENAGQFYWFAAHVNYADPMVHPFVNDLTVNGAVNNATAAALTADIALNTAPNGVYWEPIGLGTRDYAQTFDGRKHQITGFTMDYGGTTVVNGKAGLFSYTKNATLKDFSLSGSMTIASEKQKDDGAVDSFSTVLAHAVQNTIVSGVSSSVIVTINENVTPDAFGGIVGRCEGGTIVEKCHFGGMITYRGASTKSACGGVIGVANSGMVRISETSFAGMITGIRSAEGEYYAGIIARGEQANLTITKCFNAGSITVLKNDNTVCIGGILGYHNTNSLLSITDCASYGPINIGKVENGSCTSGGYVGGIMAYKRNSSASALTIKDCLSTGDIVVNEEASVKPEIGMILGASFQNNADYINNNYYKFGPYSGSGADTGTVYDTARRNLTTANAVSHSVEEILSGKTAWMLNHETSEDTPVKLDWGQVIDLEDRIPDEHPVLKNDAGRGPTVYYARRMCTYSERYSNYPMNDEYVHNYNEHGFCINTNDKGEVCNAFEPAEKVVDDDTYIIDNEGKLFWLSALVNGKLDYFCGDTTTEQNTAAKARVTEDLDMQANVPVGVKWTGIGETIAGQYTGSLDGEFHTVKMHSTNENLFTYVGGGASIKNLYVTGQITTSTKFAAGLIRHVQTGAVTIDRVISDVDIVSQINGDGTHAGLVAVVESNCSLTITNCAFIGSITGAETFSCGGMVGWTNATGASTTITDSYVAADFTLNTANGDDNSCTFSRNDNGVRVTLNNCYYETALKDMPATANQMTAEQFASGEVTYRLNGNDTDPANAWYQDIDNGEEPYDEYPMLLGGMVYQYSTCKTPDTLLYSNTDHGLGSHNYNADGFCSNSDESGTCYCFQPATIVTEENALELGLTESHLGYYAAGNAGQLYWLGVHMNYADPAEASPYVDNANANKDAAKFVAVPYGGYHNSTVTENMVLLSDIDLAAGAPDGLLWEPMGFHLDSSDAALKEATNREFAGIFDGNRRVVTNMVVERTDRIESGFFSRVQGGTVKNLGVYGTVNQAYNEDGGVRAGIFAGEISSGTVTDCYAVGTVTTNHDQFGFAGEAANSTLENCHVYPATEDVYYTMVGTGGTDPASITNCYYLAPDSTEQDDLDGTTAKTAAQFASGEVTYALNDVEITTESEALAQKGLLIWGQDLSGLDADPYPVFSDDVVYLEDGVYKNISAVSVVITWGSMDFSYHAAIWDPLTHVVGFGWSIDQENGDLVAVTNNGVPVILGMDIEEADAVPVDDVLINDGVAVSAGEYKLNGASQATLPLLNSRDIFSARMSLSGRPIEGVFDVGQQKYLAEVTVQVELPDDPADDPVDPVDPAA